jgi:branched-chain amino acid transport system ATP-binding protein
MTVLENLEMGKFSRPAAKSENAQDLEMVYGLFPRLKERASQFGGTLSGGEQQMLAIGRALMSRPRLLLLDEPSMGLAPKFIAQIFDIIQEIKKQDVTILLVEQNAAKALSIADRAYVLETGNITMSGTGQELLNDPKVRQAYLGHGA